MSKICLPEPPPTSCPVGERAPSDLPLPPECIAEIIVSLPPAIPVWEISLKVIFYTLAMVLGVGGNIIVLVIIFATKRMRTGTNMYMANLAASDLMVSCMCMWVHMGLHVTQEWPFGSVICVTNSFILGLSATGSVFFLTVISADRFFAIVYPLRSRSRTGRHWQIPLTICLTWLAAMACAMPHLFTWRMVEIRWKNRHEIFCEENWPKYWFSTDDDQCLTHQPGRQWYLTVQVFLLYGLPIVIMVAAYSMIGATLWKRQPPGEQCDTQTANQRKARKKVVRMLVAVVIAFIVCWTPYHSVVLYDVFRSRSTEELPYMRTLKYAFTYIAYFNSAMNPILYGWLNENFKKGFRDVFTCTMWKKRNKISPGGGGQMWTTGGSKQGIKGQGHGRK